MTYRVASGGEFHGGGRLCRRAFIVRAPHQVCKTSVKGPLGNSPPAMFLDPGSGMCGGSTFP